MNPPEVAEALTKLIYENEHPKISMLPLVEGKIVKAPPVVAFVVILYIVVFSSFTW
jgi:hypothetical protein